MQSVKDIFETNGGPRAMVEKTGLKKHLVYSWFYRDRIPSNYWRQLIDNPNVIFPNADEMASIDAAKS